MHIECTYSQPLKEKTSGDKRVCTGLAGQARFRLWQAIEHRLDILRETNDAHVECIEKKPELFPVTVKQTE